MIIVKKNYNDNKIEKEKLQELLKRYDDTLNKATLEYLNRLIELEFSVIKDNISFQKKENLIELELYRKIVIYNIYNRVLKLFQEEELNLNSNNGDEIHILKRFDDKDIDLFRFNYDLKANKVLEITLFQTIEESLEERAQKVNYIIGILERLQQEKNSFNPKGNVEKDILDLKLDYERRIAHYEKMLNELNKKRQLTETDRVILENSQYYYGLLLEEFGLTKEELASEKVLKKKFPRLEIKNNIKYI